MKRKNETSRSQLDRTWMGLFFARCYAKVLFKPTVAHNKSRSVIKIPDLFSVLLLFTQSIKH
jgi:hypothetical protein